MLLSISNKKRSRRRPSRAAAECLSCQNKTNDKSGGVDSLLNMWKQEYADRAASQGLSKRPAITAEQIDYIVETFFCPSTGKYVNLCSACLQNTFGIRGRTFSTVIQAAKQKKKSLPSAAVTKDKKGDHHHLKDMITQWRQNRTYTRDDDTLSVRQEHSLFCNETDVRVSYTTFKKAAKDDV